MNVPNRVNKKSLCIALEEYYPSGRCKYDVLEAGYFTDDVLDQIGITREEYKDHRGFFDYQTTKKIIEIFELTEEDFCIKSTA